MTGLRASIDYARHGGVFAQRAMSSLATVAACLIVGIPLTMVVLTSVKTSEEAKAPNLSWPQTWAPVENYAQVFNDGRIVQGFANSVLVVVPATTACLLFGAMAAWVFARRGDRWAQGLYYLSVVGVFLPPAIVTTLRVLSALGIERNRVGLSLFYAGAFVSMAVFLMVGFVRAIPIEIEEAARIDGASKFRIFARIILPSLRPIIVTTLIIVVLNMWNDFYFAFFLLGDSSQHTLPLGLYSFASGNQFELRWNLIFADIVVVSLPLIALFAFTQRTFVAGLMAGSGK